jgi:hypothetical protein
MEFYALLPQIIFSNTKYPCPLGTFEDPPIPQPYVGANLRDERFKRKPTGFPG